jgi:hypothetical protein
MDTHMKLTDQQLRVVIALSLLIGWFVVVFLRSGTAWG